MWTLRLPLAIKRTNKIPPRIDHEDRLIIQQSRTVTYEQTAKHTITVDELFEIGVNIQQLLFCWISTEEFKTIPFTNISAPALLEVHKALQHRVLKKRFAEFNWFKVGLTIDDMIRVCKLPVDVFVTFGITMEVLVEHQANDYGSNWQSFFQWSDQDWKKINFDSERYRILLSRQSSKINVDTRTISARRSWGPESKLLPGNAPKHLVAPRLHA
jgi:hypothetical protein